MNDKLIEFILAHEQEDVNKLLLKHKEIHGFPATFVVDQINGRKRSKEKLPSWYSNPNIIYPAQQNLEQSSSETTSEFKAQLVIEENGGKTLADLTGGFGVDSYSFSKVFGEVWYVEPKQELNDIAAANHLLLKTNNIKHVQTTAEGFLEKDMKFDWLFVDPSRKNNGRKVFRLSDSEPNVVQLLPSMFKRAENILIKASPLLDLKEGINQLAQTKKIFVVSVENECKEVLFLLKKGFSGEPGIVCVNLPFKDQTFGFTFSEENASDNDFDDPQEFIYEPNASILKAGAFKTIARGTRLKKIAVNTHLYTGELIKNFPGRIFKNLGALENVKQQLPSMQANIIFRNHPLSPDQIKKKFKLRDGGEKYILAFSGRKNKFLIVADRIK